MATVYEFPVKATLPKDVKECIYGIAWDYVDALYSALDYLCEDDTDYDEMETIGLLISNTFAEGLADAIDKYDVES